MQRYRSDALACQGAAQVLEKLGPTRPGDLYSAARLRAIAAGLHPPDSQMAQEDADRAMDWLTKGVAAGWRDRKHMKSDPDLDPLRGRADFRALLNSLPELAPPPRPVP